MLLEIYSYTRQQKRRKTQKSVSVFVDSACHSDNDYGSRLYSVVSSAAAFGTARFGSDFGNRSPTFPHKQYAQADDAGSAFNTCQDLTDP